MPTDRTPPLNGGRGRIHRNLKPVPSDPDDESSGIDSIPDPPKTKHDANKTAAASNSKPNGKSLFDEPEDDDDDTPLAASHGGSISAKLTALLTKPEAKTKTPSQPLKAVHNNGGEKPGSSFDDDDDDAVDACTLGKDFANSKFASPTYYEEGTLIPKGVKQVCRNGNEMIVLAQLAYWFRRSPVGGIRANKLLGADGFYWVAKSYADLGDETGLKATQVRHAVETLAARNIIIHEPHMFRGLVMSFYRIDPDALDAAIDEVDDL